MLHESYQVPGISRRFLEMNEHLNQVKIKHLINRQSPNNMFDFVCLMVFNATFNNISVISWRSVLLVEEPGGPRENH